MMAQHDQQADRSRALHLLETGANRPLTLAEQAELDQLLDRYPGLETEPFGQELARLRQITDFQTARPPRSLRSRVLLATGTNSSEPSAWSRIRRKVGLSAAAVGLVLAGALGQDIAAQLANPNPPAGPPGTLGAVEAITFTAEEDLKIDAAVVAHTWGTETRLEIAGLPIGEPFTVVLVATSGQEYASGSFIGTPRPVDCQLNAAILRPDVAAIEIRNSSGATVLESRLPPTR